MYIFDKVERAKVLQGRTIKYVAEKKLFTTPVHLTNILNGKYGCSYRLARDIVKCISPEATVEEYFVKKEK